MLVRRRAAVLLALAVLAVGCGEPTTDADAPAYDPRYFAGGAALFYHWAPGATIAVYADPTPAPADRDLADALRAAFSAWRDAAHFREFKFALVARPEDADVVVHFRGASPVTFADCDYPGGGGAGLTFFCPSADGTRALVLPLTAGGGGHVRMDVRLDEGAITSAASFQAVVTHEIGHVLGIGAHSPEPADLMFSAPTVTVPNERDAATLRYVLHQPSALVL